MKSSEVRWEGYVARITQMRNAYISTVQKFQVGLDRKIILQ